LETQDQWQHNFGLSGDIDNAIGKMFGVLLVQYKLGEIGYLSAFSGKLAEENLLPAFVPPVFDMLTEGSFFLEQQQEINQLSNQLEALEADPKIPELKKALEKTTRSANQAIAAHRALMVESRKNRKSRRTLAETELDHYDLQRLLAELGEESVREKLYLRDLKQHWDEQVSTIQIQLDQITDKISALKKHRKVSSNDLQHQLFQQYRFLNTRGIERDLNEIFSETDQKIPPAGSGECAAPKLLNYAFQWEMKPLAMAEFWWGRPPKSEVRQHGNFYPSCKGKCKLILAHMLEGIPMDDNPLVVNSALGKTINIVYQDEAMLVVNKPAEFLSVPGKSVEDSVYYRMKQAFPEATGPLIVHRLDMSTSGLMVLALNQKAHKQLQKQFIERTAKKRYVALLEGQLKQEEGFINLPLRVDLEDRPRQLVCYEHGKSAETKWQVIEQRATHTKVYLYPKTGRTHQLRVHSAHSQGLNMPIVGDDLYGKKANRLHLHAESLSIKHPLTKELMHFQIEADF
jgi:tRNA pseudouridine32 synthase/23S rRNA pseudouridine746 synthase